MLRELFRMHHKDPPSFIDAIEDHDQLHVIRLKGAIDMSTIPELERMVLHAQKKNGMLDKNILVDFKKVSHVDSATIAMLLGALSDLKHHKHKLVLANLTRELKEKLKIAKLDKIFTIAECEGAACDELKKGLME